MRMKCTTLAGTSPPMPRRCVGRRPGPRWAVDSAVRLPNGPNLAPRGLGLLKLSRMALHACAPMRHHGTAARRASRNVTAGGERAGWCEECLAIPTAGVERERAAHMGRPSASRGGLDHAVGTTVDDVVVAVVDVGVGTTTGASVSVTGAGSTASFARRRAAARRRR